MISDNLAEIPHQMECFGIVFRPGERSALKVDGRRHTCGKGGKYWYKLREMRLNSGRVLVVGSFGSYKTGNSERVDINWAEVSEEEKARWRAQREAAEAIERAERAREAEEAACTAADLWRRGQQEGQSPYLVRKGVEGEACRFMRDGSILVPLIRYDFERAQALRGVQRIYGGPRFHWRTGEELPQKVFTKNFDKPGCATRLGLVVSGEPIVVCEGYATGLSIRMATERRWPVFVALDAGNLLPVLRILRGLYPTSPLVVAADDDWKTRDHLGRPDNVGRRKANEAVKEVPGCLVAYPAFGPARQREHTDYNDLHALEGLPTVRRQLLRVIEHARVAVEV